MRISDWSSDVCSSNLDLDSRIHPVPCPLELAHTLVTAFLFGADHQHLARLPKARELEIVVKIGLRACRPINVIDQLAEPVIGFARKRHPFAGPNKSPRARRFELQQDRKSVV